MIYLKNFRAARANLLRISEEDHEKSMLKVFRATPKGIESAWAYLHHVADIGSLGRLI